MILGYVDSSNRLYDVGFGTLKMKMQVESREGAERVLFAKATGEGEISFRVQASADVTASLSMDHDGRTVPLLRPVEGRGYRHEGGLLFIASPRKREAEEPGYFLVQVRAMPSALKFFFEDRQGTEFISVPQEEVLRVAEGSRGTTVFVSAESVALPNEKIAYALELSPPSRAVALVRGFAMSH
jgi:hypothetical protein